MLKLLYLLRRVPGLSLEEFQEHWLEYHCRFGRANRSVLRYVQYHTLANDPVAESLAQAGDTEATEPYDGMAVAWFEDADRMKASLGGDLVAEALADEKHFIDHARSVAVLADEHVHIEPSEPSPIVLVECLARPQTIDRATFSERWLHHKAIGLRAHEAGYLDGYIQNHALPENDPRHDLVGGLGTGGEVWDGVVTAYFHSVAIAKELFQSPLASEESYEDEKSFIDHAKGVYMLTRRHVIKDLVR